MLAGKENNMDEEVEKQKREAQRNKMREDIAKRKEQLRLQREALALTAGAPSSPAAKVEEKPVAEVPRAVEAVVAPVVASPAKAVAPEAVVQTVQAPVVSVAPVTPVKAVEIAPPQQPPVVSVAHSTPVKPVEVATLPLAASPARVASPAAVVASPSTPQHNVGRPVSTPKTVLQSDVFSPGFEDDADDVVLAPDLFALSEKSAAPPSGKIPDYVRPAVTPTNTKLPDSSWLTPPMGHKLVSSPASAALSPKTLHLGTGEKAGRASPALFAGAASASEAKLPMPVASPAAAPVSPNASLFNVSAGNPVFTPLQGPQSTPNGLGNLSGAGLVFTPPPQQHDVKLASPMFTPVQSDRLVAEAPKSAEQLAFAEKLELVKSPQAEAVEVAEEEEPEEDRHNAANASFEEVAEDQPEVATFGGYGLLSPIREETDEYAMSSREQQMPEPSSAAKSPFNVAAERLNVEAPQQPQVSTPVKSQPATPLKSDPAPTLVKSEPAVATPAKEPLIEVPLPTPAAPSVAVASTPLATPARVAMVSPIVSPPSQLPKPAEAVAQAVPIPSASGEQSELDRIKQKIRVWDVASPKKTAKAQTPEKQPRFTEVDLAEAKRRAEEAAAEENARLRAEHVELQQKYEAEKALSKQMKEIVDEFEASVRVLVDGHKAALVAEKNAFAKLQAENLTLMELVEENQKKVERLNDEKQRAAAELATAAAAARTAEETAARVAVQLEASTNKYQSLKQQAEQKLALANERIQQQLAMNQDQIALIKGKLAQAVAKNGELTEELAGKKKENQELVTICDQLVQQLESATSK